MFPVGMVAFAYVNYGVCEVICGGIYGSVIVNCKNSVSGCPQMP